MTPNDPYYSRQWHLQMIGDLQTVWNEYRGGSVHVGVYDTGVDFTNPDLAARHDPSRSVVVDGQTRDGAVTTTEHGTAVAGLIAASGNNGTGVVGVAWEAGLTSVNIFDPSRAEYSNSDSQAAFLSVLHQMTNFDVVNNSWNSRPVFSEDQKLSDPTSSTAARAAEYAYVSANGRGGLGTVIVQSAGNDSANVNAAGLNASRHTITVAATLEDGFATQYSNQGAAVLVTAPGSPFGTSTIVTTDRVGSAGANPGGASDGFDGTGNYRADFNGTSAAAPIVSGVVALMLDANPGLGWRDVQNILAASATHTGSAIGAAAPATEENGVWVFNGGDSWNGGGAHFSPDYGYGMVDAFNAVRMAEAWHFFSPDPETSANERSLDTGTITANATIPDNGAVTFTFTVTGSLAIEHVALEMRLTHPALHRVRIFLVSADGTEMRLSGGGGESNRPTDGWTWTFGADGLRGELAEGSWSVRIEDTIADGFTGTLNWLRLTAYGATPGANDVYHYTDELSDMVALAGARRTLADTDGGTDLIEAAAVHAASRIDLGAGTASIDGVALTLSGIENALSGDGNDTLVGDAGANVLRGMRGADSLTGAAGDDVLDGGAGADTLDGGEGQDTADYGAARMSGDPFAVLVFLQDGIAVYGDASGDVLIGIENVVGSAFGDALFGDGDANRLAGGGGNDELYGQGGDDLLAGGTGGDALDGGDGVDTADYSAALLMAGNPFAVLVYLMAEAGYYGAAAGDVLRGIENLVGSAFGDGLLGDDGVNRIEGGGGADELYGYGGNDTLLGGAGNDTMDGGDAMDIADYSANTALQTVIASLATGVANDGQGGTDDLRNMDALAGGAAVDRLVGNDAANLLLGNAGADTMSGAGGADTLDGGTGNDRMIGGGGDDLFLVDAATDMVVEVANGGSDTVRSSVDYTLGNEIETLVLTAGATTGTGSGGNNLVIGNADDNTLIGGAGDDTLFGDTGADSLIGGAGLDRLAGAGGNDSYLVDVTGDMVTELVGSADAGGVDEVRSTATFTLTAHIETLTLLGSVAIDGTGNAQSNLITGNAGANRLNGGDGADTLNGGTGADTLDGGTGADTLIGGTGNDQFVVSDPVDLIIEGANGGTDLVLSSIRHVLRPNVENLKLTGTASVDGIGNVSNNVITGNAGANALSGVGGNDTLMGGGNADVLDGGIGDDSMVGGLGDDAYFVDHAGDVAMEEVNGGIDTVRTANRNHALGANLENLVFDGVASLAGDGNALANRLTGNAGNNLLRGFDDRDILAGGDGADTLSGGSGADVLTGGKGADVFLFGAPGDGFDRIVDFGIAGGADRIGIDVAAFGGGLTAGALDPSRFVAQTDAKATSAPGTGQFVYVTTADTLYWDADGAGSAAGVRFAAFTGGPSLSASDFILV